MFLPKLIPYEIKQSSTSEFDGINRTKACGEDSFYDTLGLCSLEHPVLASAPEKQHFEVGFENAAEVMPFENKGLGAVCGAGEAFALEFEGERISPIKFSEGISKGNIINFNSKTLFVKGRDAYEFDPAEKRLDELGVTLDIKAKKASGESEGPNLFISLLYNDLGSPGKFSTGGEEATFPLEASVNDCFARNLNFYRMIYKDPSNPEKNEWQIQTSFRLRLDISEPHRKFKAGDYIRLKGLKYWNWTIREFPELERFLRIDEVDEEGGYITEAVEAFSDMVIILSERKFPSNDIIGYDDPYINNKGNYLPLLSGELSACMPEMDFILGGANRVWGCSNAQRAIYCCELGNARNWSVFEGLSSDSYALGIASPGDFTACINYLGTPVFFKENEMLVINGTKPSSFSLSSYSCRGVAKDSPSGLCVVNDVLYYKSNDGIYDYNSSKPRCISQKLGEEAKLLCDVKMCGEGDMLFLSGRLGEEHRHYCYDTLRGIWHRYDSKSTLGYVSFTDTALELCRDEDGLFFSSLYAGAPKNCTLVLKKLEQGSWFWESGDIFYNTPNRKYVGRIRLDTECEGGAALLISYNGSEFQKVCDIPPHKRGSRDITLFPRRCDYFRLRMEGQGKFTMYTVTKEVEEAKENG